MMDSDKARDDLVDERGRLAFRAVAVISIGELVIGLGLLLSDPEYPKARIAIVAMVGLLTIVMGALEILWLSRGPRPISRIAIPVTNVFAFGVIIAVTDGLAGPLAPLLFHVPIGQAARHGRSVSAVASAACALVVVLLLMFLPSSWAGPTLADPQLSICRAVILGGVLLSMALEVGLVSDAHKRVSARMDTMRENILSEHEQRARGLEAIGARVAHELKNPLTSIKSLLSLHREEEENEAAQERLGVVSSEVDRMRGIIQDYLSFSRPLDRLRLSEVDPNRLASDVVDVLSARARKAGVELILSGHGPSLTADAGRLRAALMNFVINAIEATPHGGTVGVTVETTGSGAVSLQVRDTGRGLTAEELASLGTPFFTTKDQGTGLGVVIAKSTIEQHGGTIRYESTSGGGTTLRIELPTTRGEQEDRVLDSFEGLAKLDEEALAQMRADYVKKRKRPQS